MTKERFTISYEKVGEEIKRVLTDNNSGKKYYCHHTALYRHSRKNKNTYDVYDGKFGKGFCEFSRSKISKGCYYITYYVRRCDL